MIPKIIHYCWFGRGEMPELALKCIESWHMYMPDWEYKLWNEDNFDVNSTPYTKEAYEARKYAFVSDYVRLHALYHEGGLYMDVDFEVYKPFDELMVHSAFAGYEGSKHIPVMMGVAASRPHGEWLKEQLDYYLQRHFLQPDGSLDITTNVTYITNKMMEQGLVCDGKEKDYKDLHIFPVDYFCPRQTTGEYFRTANTYCEHKGLDSWSDHKKKPLLLRLAGPKMSILLIKLKRKLVG